MYKVLWDFETETDHLIMARQPDLVIVTPPKKNNNKKNQKKTVE